MFMSFDILFYLFIQYFKRVTHLAVIAILPCGPLCKHIYIYTYMEIIRRNQKTCRNREALPSHSSFTGQA